jgi:hypothetical protein
LGAPLEQPPRSCSHPASPGACSFQNSTSLWISVIGGTIKLGPVSIPDPIAGAVSHYNLVGGQWKHDKTITVDAVWPVYSITGRDDSAYFGCYQIYAASVAAAYRVDTCTNAVHFIAVVRGPAWLQCSPRFVVRGWGRHSWPLPATQHLALPHSLHIFRDTCSRVPLCCRRVC